MSANEYLLMITSLGYLLKKVPQTNCFQNVAEESEESPNREGDEVMRRPWFMRGGEQRPWHTDDHPKLFPEDAPGEDRLVHNIVIKTMTNV